MQKKIKILISRFRTKEFLRFFVSGSTAFLVDFVILNLLILAFNFNNNVLYILGIKINITVKIIGIAIFIPNVISTIFGIITTFSLNKYWTFKSKINTIFSETWRFGLVLIFNYILNNILFGLIRQNFYLSDQVIKIVVTGMQMFWTFLLYKFVVFRKF